jgi:hypothetical protein
MVAAPGRSASPVGRAVLVDEPVLLVERGVELADPAGVGADRGEERAVARLRSRCSVVEQPAHCFHRHTDLGPRAPADGPHRRRMCVGERVEEGVGGDVVDLPGRAGDRAGGGTQRKQLQRLVGGDFVQHQRAVHLGGEHPLDVDLLLLQQRRVVGDTGGVHDPVEAAEGAADGGHDAAHVRDVGDVARHHRDIGAVGDEGLHPVDALHHGVVVAERVAQVLPLALRRQRLAGQQDQLRGHPLVQAACQREADAAEPAGDHHHRVLFEGECLGLFAGAAIAAPQAAGRAPCAHTAVGRGGGLVDQCVHQRCEVGLCGGAPTATASPVRLGQLHVEGDGRHVGQLVGSTSTGPEHRGLLRPDDASIASRACCCVGARHHQMQWTPQAVRRPRLHEEDAGCRSRAPGCGGRS